MTGRTPHLPPGEVAGLFLLACAVVLLFVEPLHGPVLVSLSGRHGLDLGDLVAAPLVLAAVVLLRGQSLPRRVLALLRGSLRGVDPLLAGLLLSGAGLLVVQVVGLPSTLRGTAHLGVVGALPTIVGLAILLVALTEPGAARRAFGAPAFVVGLALVAGFLIDATDGPAGSVVGPTFLAALLAVTLGRRRVAAGVAFGLLTVFFVVIDFSALVDTRAFETSRELNGGGLVRAGALGLVLVLTAVFLPHTTRRVVVTPGARTA